MNNPIFYRPHGPKALASAKTSSNRLLAGRKKLSPPSTVQSHHSSQRAEYDRLLSGMDFVEVVDLTGSNGVDSPMANQQPADGITANVRDKVGGVEKRDGDDVRAVNDAVAYEVWDESLINPDSNAPKTSHIDRSGTARNVSVLSPATVGDNGDNFIRIDDSQRGETGSGREPLTIDTTAGEQDHRLTDSTEQVDPNHSIHEPSPNSDTTIHAIAANSSGQIINNQLSIPRSNSGGCDKDKDQQTQPNPPLPRSAERNSTPQGPADTLKHDTDTFRPELARPSPTDVGLLDGTSKPTNPLDLFPPGSPTEVATEGSSPVDPVDSTTARGASYKAVSAGGKSNQEVRLQSPHRPQRISSPEPSTAAAPPSNEHLATTSPPACSSLSKALPLGKDGNKTMDYVNRLSREQQDQYAPLSDKRLPNITAQPRRDEHQGHKQPGGTGRKRKADSQFPTSDQPAKRHRSSAKPTLSHSSVGRISASSSRDDARGDTPASQGDGGPPPVDAENNRYAVVRLLDRRIRRLRGRNRQVIQYLVRWEGYGPNDDEWVDEGDIDEGLIQAYATSSTKSA